MVAARLGTVVLPQSAGLLRHLEIVPANLPGHLLVAAFALQYDEPQKISYEGVRRPDFLVESLGLPNSSVSFFHSSGCVFGVAMPWKNA